MKICYVSEGTSVHDERFLSSLVERGYEMHLVSFHRGEILESIGKSGVHIHHRKSATYIDPFLLRSIVSKIKPAVVHSGFLQTYGFCAALVDHHPILSMPWGSDIFYYPKRALLWNLITRFTLSSADMITCDCEEAKKEILRLIEFPRERIIVFPWGINLKKFNPVIKDEGIREKLGWKDNLIVVYDRQFKGIYGVTYLIEAIPKVVKKIQNARFLFCGTGPLEEKMKKEIAERGLSNYVYFAGFVKNEELPKYLNSADLYVSCSLSDGTSVCLLEAMACGLPVVVTNLPAILEWIVDGENGSVVPVKDSEVLAQRIIELLENKELRRRFSERNINVARKRADWEKNVSILESIYEKLKEEEPMHVAKRKEPMLLRAFFR